MLDKKIPIAFACFCFVSHALAKAIIDPDVAANINQSNITVSSKHHANKIPIILFLHSEDKASSVIKDLKQQNISVKQFNSIPALLVLLPTNASIVKYVTNHPAVMQLSSYQGSTEELEISEQAILLRPSELYPTIDNWWDNGYTGKNVLVGLIDSGVATEHPSLSQTNILVLLMVSPHL